MKCPNCDGTAYNVGRKFKTPKRSDASQWEKVKFLFSNGFHFQSVYVDGKRIPYPDTLEEAKEFVKKYKNK
jgi:hypothetical protein